MSLAEKLQALHEIKTGVDLPKCQQCGCMQETLYQINQVLPQLPSGDVTMFKFKLPAWRAKMKPARYSCLGCDHCYAGSAQNAFTGAFPQVAGSFGLSCEIQLDESAWPPVVGDYVVVIAEAPVAVVTLASLELPKRIAARRPAGLAIAGKLETENIGIDKLIKNVIANPHIRFLLVVGLESVGHQSGQTLLALADQGVDSTGRVIGSDGKRPVLKNVTSAEIEAFRKQVTVIDLIGCEDLDRIANRIQELARQTVDQPAAIAPCGCAGGACERSLTAEPAQPVLIEDDQRAVRLDPAGYFVIYPIAERGLIHVEHYAYDNHLLHTLESSSPRALYLKIIEEGWVTEMSHAAFLGKELMKADFSLKLGTPYSQDAA